MSMRQMQIEGKKCFCRHTLEFTNPAFTDTHFIFKFYYCNEFFFLTVKTMKKAGDDFDRFSQANHALTLQNQCRVEDYFTFWWGMKDEVTQCCICDIRVLLKSEGS